jgi:hypothetical protein
MRSRDRTSRLHRGFGRFLGRCLVDDVVAVADGYQIATGAYTEAWFELVAKAHVEF